jgi:methyl-accepting chemotaxis protein
MKKNRMFMLKFLMQLYGPMLIIILLIMGATFFTTNKSSLFAVFGFALCLMIVSMLFSAVNFAKQLSWIDQIVNCIVKGDVSIDEDDGYRDLANNASDLEQSMLLIIRKMKTYAHATAQLATGNVKGEIPTFSDDDIIGKNLLSMGHSLERLKSVTEDLHIDSFGHIFKHVDPEFQGMYRTIVENIHRHISELNEKVSLYENAMDAIPYPLHILNPNSKWIFINKACDRLFQETHFAGPRESIYGTKYCKLNLTECNQVGCNDSCSIYCLIANDQTSFDFERQGKYYHKNVQYIENTAADQIGFVEITIDVTPIVSTNHYMEVEVLRLKNNLLLLAAGDLSFDQNIGEANQYTTEIFTSFNEICNSLSAVKRSIGYLVADADFLTQAIIKGNLEIQADEMRLSGSWQTIIKGMNNILTSVAKPLHEVSAVMDDVSSGNLSVMVSGQYEGDFGKLKQAVNHTVKQLNRVITEISSITKEISTGNLNINEIPAFEGDFVGISDSLNLIIVTLNILLRDINISAELVSSGANQVAVGSQSLAQGTTEQASSLEELTATISAIAIQTKDSAINANKARELSSSVRDTAAVGNKQMNEMQVSMININQSSNDISKIIKVIDDIAFQTNILALNAAVEAARAGQLGKGFAVVAEEVRTLAARSADAAKETTALIEGSIKKVKVGTAIADETAAALMEIVTGIEKVTDLVKDISEASNEQATAIAQINTGIEQVAQVVQQNSATSEESAATSEEMSSQAELLKESINQFQLREQSN